MKKLITKAAHSTNKISNEIQQKIFEDCKKSTYLTGQMSIVENSDVGSFQILCKGQHDRLAFDASDARELERICKKHNRDFELHWTILPITKNSYAITFDAF